MLLLPFDQNDLGSSQYRSLDLPVLELEGRLQRDLVHVCDAVLNRYEFVHDDLHELIEISTSNVVQSIDWRANVGMMGKAETRSRRI